VGYEQFLGPELFFNPEIFSEEWAKPLPDVVDEAILASPIDSRRALYQVGQAISFPSSSTETSACIDRTSRCPEAARSFTTSGRGYKKKFKPSSMIESRLTWRVGACQKARFVAMKALS
jgi:hypothetical protein